MQDVGQLIITGVSGKELSDNERIFLEKENIGGVILFTRNYENPAQLAELVNSIQQLRKEYPLFISVDHEGGRVIRFKSHFTQFPDMLSIGELNSPKITYEVHRIMADELHTCGINLNFSPCCDIFSNPSNKVIGDRAFGRSAPVVEKHATAAIRGLQTNNVIACAKHFPGHGNTIKDSHYDLPVVKTDLDLLKKREFEPFHKASKARVEFMMMAHLIVDVIDSELPTSLSKKAYDLLRDEIKFSKLIITDDMEMKAIADNFSTEEAAVLAINAGADIVIYRTMDEAQKALSGLKDAIKKQVIKKVDIEQKLSRITDCKKRYLSEYSPVDIASLPERLNTLEAQNLVNQIKSGRSST